MMRISAVIPAYNREKHISRAIDSVLNQTRPADEIIVVDDGSVDKTAEIVSSYGDKVRLIQQQNAGASAARNTGIEAATGDWIAFLDADDEWLPDMLERQCAIIVQNSHLAWTSGNYRLCLCKKGYALPKDDPQKIQTMLNGKAYFDDYLNAYSDKVRGWTCCMVIRKDVLKEVGLFCTDLPKANDLDMWFRIAYQYPQIGFAPEPLAIYHMEAGDCISIRPMMYDYLKAFIQRHLNLAKDANRLGAFTPVAAQMAKSWMRSALFDDRIYDVRKAVHQFDFLPSKGYLRIIYVMTILPGLTKHLLQSLSWISQTFKLRRQTWHPHKRYRRK